MKRLILLLSLLLARTAFAYTPTGQFVQRNLVWRGIARTYGVYVPRHLPAHPSMLIYLHGTFTGTAVTWQFQQRWEALADGDPRIIVWPIASYEPRAGQRYWQAYALGFSFTRMPDDAGFLRYLISRLTVQYAVDPRRIFVTGLSSGAMMTQRVGVELSDLVAAIVPVAGQLSMIPLNSHWTPSRARSHISVFEQHGDEDRNLEYCGQSPHEQWREPHMSLAGVDAGIRYWAAENGCSVPPSLCSGGVPTSVQNIDLKCPHGIEVEFEREVGRGHTWFPDSFHNVWAFFAAHPK